jgi:hypothetical protein
MRVKRFDKVKISFKSSKLWLILNYELDSGVIDSTPAPEVWV